MKKSVVQKSKVIVPEFQSISERLRLHEFVQMSSAQLEGGSIVQSANAQIGDSASLLPMMIAEYKRLLIPEEVMKKSLEEYCTFIKKEEGGLK
jgi:hypothetical protein